MEIRIYNEPVLFIDFSYYILHKYFAIHTWCKLSKQTMTEDEMIQRFVDKFEENFVKLAKKYCVQPDNVFFIGDCRRNNIWRKDIYPEYKSSRDLLPTTIPPKFFEIVYSIIIPNITKKFNNHFVTVDHLEGDDIIAILTRYALKKEFSDITIITNDNDYQQLNHEHVKIYNLKNIDICKRGFGDPTQDLRQKILLGDKSDNIKPICSTKVANGIIGLNETQFFDYLQNNKLVTDYTFNETLIDFEHIPEPFVKDIQKNIRILNRVLNVQDKRKNKKGVNV